MIPILFERNEISFTTNGICRLRDCISAVVVEERNSIYELDFDYPVSGANYDQIECGRIVGVTHDEDGDIQPFEIVSFTRPIDGVVSFHCVHISYRQSQMTVSGTNINSLADAFELLKTAEPSNPFTYESTFSPTGYMASADGTPRTVRQMLGGVSGSILDVYGGEYEWDKFTVRLHRNRGEIKDFAIRYGVNLLKYDDETDYQNTFTSCVPYWKSEEGELVMAEVSTGALAYNGNDIRIPLDLSDKFENAPTVAQLEEAGRSYMQRNNTNVPAQSISVDFVRLSELGEYDNLRELLTCKLCDSITVIFPMYGVQASFKIVRTEWDVLADRYNGMELGSLRTTLSEALGISGDSPSMSGNVGGTSLYYGVCSTASGTAAKTVTVSPSISSLEVGTLVSVKFDNSNAVANPTLNVNGTGDIAIKRYGTTAPATSTATSWNAGSVFSLIYDGTYWQMVGWLNTSYSSMSDAEYQAGTSTTARLITPARLKAAIAYWVSKKAALFSSRQADANLTADGQTGVSHFLATGTMTANKPANGDGHIIHMAWDNTGGWDSQMYVKNGNAPVIRVRGQSSGTWGTWQKVYTENEKPTASEVGALPLTGGTMTGQILTSFNNSVAMGSYGASATTVPNLVAELRFSSGCMGSASIGTAYTKDGITIGTGWYNFIYSPHRSGGANGAASGDNCNYGNLLLMGMTVGGAYLIRVASAAIQEVKIFGEENTSKTTFTPTHGSSYSNYGGCYYEKRGRTVHVHLGLSGLTASTSATAFTLPSGYRPSSPIYAYGTGGAWNTLCYVAIGTGGAIDVRSQGTYCGADITFMI